MRARPLNSFLGSDGTLEQILTNKQGTSFLEFKETVGRDFLCRLRGIVSDKWVVFVRRLFSIEILVRLLQ